MAGGSSNPNKGKRFERSIVNESKEIGVSSKRMYGSDGSSAGFHPEVDVVFELKNGKLIKAQAKYGHSYRLPKYINLSNVDIFIIKQPLKAAVVILPLTDYLNLVKESDK